MKFSYTLLKQLVPQIKSKKELVEKLTLHSFETEGLSASREKGGENAIDVKLPPNRFSDAVGHWGLAQEISAIYGRNFRFPITNLKFSKIASRTPLKIKIEDKNLCSRYMGQYFENVKVGPSPKWMQKILLDCGMRPINNVVDVMNYTMLETGQPLHAFDYDKIGVVKIKNQRLEIRNKPRILNSEFKTITVRKAKKKEKVTTLDNQEIRLNEDVLIITDGQNPIAIAGVKGGELAEVDKKTKRVIVEAANFDATNIYKSSRNLGLITDASLRFSRGLSPELVPIGILRAGELLKKSCGAKAGAAVDVNYNKSSKKVIKFDVGKFADFIGLEMDFIEISKYFARLGFKTISNLKSFSRRQAGQIPNSFLVEVPLLRQDIETFEDLCEEIVRLYGYNRLESVAPRGHLLPSGFEDQIVLKDKIRKILTGFGFKEAQNHSFISREDAKKYRHPELVEVENPISAEYQYLRPCLTINFIKNIISNSRFFDEVKLFEIGNIFFQLKKFKNPSEVPTIGLIWASKKDETFFRLKGVASALFKKIGVVDFLLAPAGRDNWIKEAAGGYLDIDNSLKIEVGGSSIIGYLGKLKIHSDLKDWRISVFEADIGKLLEYVEAEHEYLPLPKYPSIIRDISMWVAQTTRVGDIMQAIQENGLTYIEDVDLMDEYIPKKSKVIGYTFRIVFQAEDRTLTDKEVNKIMEKIVAELKRKFKVEIR